MITPRLVVTTGYPGSGKSTVAEYLTQRHNFVRLSTDTLRDMLYAARYTDISERVRGEDKESLVWKVLSDAKLTFLHEGLDVVIDSTAPNIPVRRSLLRTAPLNGVEKYLLYIQVDKPVLKYRNEILQGVPDQTPMWDGFWQPPWCRVPGEDYTLVQHVNNTTEDKENLFHGLDARFNR
jgi:predicted kinase